MHTLTPSEVLAVCEKQIAREQAAFVAELAKRWPVGTEISFWFTMRVKNCTIGTVLGHHEDGRVRVELQKVNRRGHRTIKRVYWRQIS